MEIRDILARSPSSDSLKIFRIFCDMATSIVIPFPKEQFHDYGDKKLDGAPDRGVQFLGVLSMKLHACADMIWP